MDIMTSKTVEFIAVAIYGLGAVFSLIGCYLYWGAFLRMKRTKIIGALAFLLTAVCIDTGWWMFTEFTRFMTGKYSEFMVAPFTLIIIKLILAISVIIFVVQSVRVENGSIEKCSKHLNKIKTKR